MIRIIYIVILKTRELVSFTSIASDLLPVVYPKF